ncbi:cysteine desulfurase family protein [Streptococcus ratti]|uniref:Aminotransferase n=1 Tax=Streptococcus ratti FA-1 = DSM 20564 TaxID=699248 RepID=A0ABP2QXB0_STRRT|nr:cysteine desulfurase family protein [Streptococcus ratti]EJN93695.1 putative aminotransferase [Streptococcus ratti FA-1 = DSM 20564]EMP71256.1 aminotransferase [Streptococcus ratti FA-1 = DSM 20564]QEY07555.1 cysteine desulfurase [Streptococcus ratti]VEI60007.1 aminotransferase [Streptococcus mutans]
MIYFDNSATTLPYPEAIKTYEEAAAKVFGNPSSLHRLGSQATRILQASRQQIAALLDKSEKEIFFTSGGTEGDNWVIKGVAFEKKHYGKHIIVSDIEHPAVKESAKWLQDQGFAVDFAPVDARGFVDVKALADLIRPETTLVSVMAVNNEIGSVQPIEAISELLSDKPTISFHVDAVQAVGKVARETYLTDRVDFATFSGHKFHSVRGVGFIYKKAGKRISPLLNGGGQEAGLRSTTENVAGIAATAKALRMVLDKEAAAQQKLQSIKETLAGSLSVYEDVTLFSGMDHFAPNILTFGIKGVRGEVLVHAFEKHDIYISTTSACSSKAGKPAGTLIAMGIPAKLAQTAVRISLDDDNDMSQAEQFLTTFKHIYQQTRKVR